MAKWLIGKQNIIGIVIFFGFFGLYTLTAVKVSVNYADSDDLTLASYFGGLAHPPGYPLLVGLIYPWLRLLPVTAVAVAANTTSAVLSAMTVALMYFCVIKVLKSNSQKTLKEVDRVNWVAVLTAITYGTWQTVWWHARIFEAFPLASLLLMFVVWLTLCLKEARNHRKIVILLIGFIAALAIGHHLLSGLLVLPTLVYGYVTVKNRKEYLFYLISGFLTGMTGYFFLYRLFPINESGYSWPINKNWNEILRFFLRFSYTDDGSAIETYTREFNIFHSLMSVIIWVEKWLKETYGYGLILVIWGGLSLFKLNKRDFWWLTSIIVLSGMILTFYHKYPLITANEIAYYWGTALRWRMQFVCALPMALLTAFGWNKLLSLVGQKQVLLIMVILMAGFFNRAGILSQNILVQEHSQEILNSLPLDAVLLVDGDQVFNILFQQKLFMIRNDVRVIPLRFDLGGKKEIRPELTLEKISDEGREAEKIISYLDETGEVFLYTPTAELLNFLGVEGNPFYAIPYGYTLKIAREMPSINSQFSYRSSVKTILNKSKFDSDWNKGFTAQLSLIHAQMMYFWERLGYAEAAARHKDLAIELAQSKQSQVIIENSNKAAESFFTAQGTYAVYEKPKAAAFLDKIYHNSNANTEDLRYAVSRAIMIEPKNKQYQLMLPY